VINVARGQHLIEKDLLAALDSGQLEGACLDVFEVEPLPADHPFWSHPKIIVTPHISSITYPKAVAPQIMNNYHRMKSGKALLHLVDIDRGY
jgi:glyoxylate/hydroxypyruvate reductase A